LLGRAEEAEGRALPLDDEARAMLIRMSDGDGRASHAGGGSWRAAAGRSLWRRGLQRIVQRRAPIYDKGRTATTN
jgi:putative ATPase